MHLRTHRGCRSAPAPFSTFPESQERFSCDRDVVYIHRIRREARSIQSRTIDVDVHGRVASAKGAPLA